MKESQDGRPPVRDGNGVLGCGRCGGTKFRVAEIDAARIIRCADPDCRTVMLDG